MFTKVSSLTDRLDSIADRLQEKGFKKEAEEIDVVSNTLDKMAKKIPAGSDRPAPIFSDSDPDVTDGKDHYPIPDEKHARSALQRLSQFWDSKPFWWKGSLETLRSKIISAVKSKFPDMEIDEEKFKNAAEAD